MAEILGRVHTENNSVQFYLGGKELFASILLSLEQASSHIHLQMYIFSEDLTGKKVEQALIEAAQRGVKVFVVLDAFGSKELSHHTLDHWRKSGIKVRVFSPLFGNKGMRIRRRLHQKIICVDGRIGFTGGVNVSDRYSGYSNEVPWLDHMVRIEGEAVYYLERLCRIYWGRNRRHIIPLKEPVSSNGNSIVSVLRNDRMRGKAEIARMYRHALRNSRESVIIFASYFLPGSRLRKEIRKASERNVKILLVLPGRSDVGIADRAMHYLYPWLFRCGIEVFEWDKSVLHAKVMIVDDKWMTVGSYNLNHLSDFSSIEANVEIIDPEFVSACKEDSMKLIRQDCRKVDPMEFRKRTGPWTRWRNKTAYVIVRLLFRLLYFLTSRE